MGVTLLGVPLVFWAVVCFGVAIAYYFFWPQPSPRRQTPRTPFQHIVIRYFHALVWVLLGIGCLLGGFTSGELGRWVALAAIPVYAIFLVYVLRDRNVELADAVARRRASGTGTGTPG